MPTCFCSCAGENPKIAVSFTPGFKILVSAEISFFFHTPSKILQLKFVTYSRELLIIKIVCIKRIWQMLSAGKGSRKDLPNLSENTASSLKEFFL